MSDFRRLLLEISNEITNAELAKLKFLCGDEIPLRTLQGMSNPFELFTALLQGNLLSEQKREYLASKLSCVNRVDLSIKLLGIQDDTPVIAVLGQEQNEMEALRKTNLPWVPMQGAPGNNDRDEMEALRQTNLPWVQMQGAPGNNDREGVPGEERQPFPRLHEMQSALPTTRSGMGGVQEYGESSTTSDSTSSSTRVPRFGGIFATVEREPLPYEAPSGEGSNERDFVDGGPGVTEPLQTSPPVALLRSQLHLDRDGAFLDPEKYDPIKYLSKGGFAKVYMVRDKSTGKISACKMFDLGENDKHIQEKTKKAEQEVKILSALKHRFIVEFHHTDQAHNTFLIFMEYMEGGSVQNHLKDKGPLKEPVVQKFTRQLLDAVAFLHNIPTNPVIHKDIKGANILLDKPHENIKLADFGISTIMQDLRTVTGGKLTKTYFSLCWASPELLASKGCGRKTDIWSVGCTVIEMLTAKPPLCDPENEHLDDRQRMCKILNLEVRPPKICSPLAIRFIDQCLSAREKRPEASELLKTDEFVKVPL